MINTLIVDDSSLARDILRDFLEAEGSFKIIGEAADGEEGVQKILSMNPDLVTLDIEMPGKNGLEVIEEVLKSSFVPIVVVTSHDTAKNAYEATLRGAMEFYPKDTFSASLTPAKRDEIYETLKRISSVKAWKNVQTIEPEPEPEPESAFELEGYFATPQDSAPPKKAIRAVVLASSTGGPKALASFVPLLGNSFPVPLVIVQHNSSGFDNSFAQWLNTFTALNVKLADDGEMPMPSTVYIARNDRHLELRLTAGREPVFHYNDDAPLNNQKPAADVLFRTAAESLKDSVISVVLTGMGSDGAEGTRKIKEAGGITFAQDEESSLIYGMPKAAAETGCVQTVLPLEKIPEALLGLLQ